MPWGCTHVSQHGVPSDGFGGQDTWSAPSDTGFVGQSRLVSLGIIHPYYSSCILVMLVGIQRTAVMLGIESHLILYP